jgi:hypothetical protein
MLEKESKNHDELIEWLIERVALLESPHQQLSALPIGPDYMPLSEVPTVPRQAAALPGLSYEIDALRQRAEAQETQISEDALLIERLRTELDAAREEALMLEAKLKQLENDMEAGRLQHVGGAAAANAGMLTPQATVPAVTVAEEGMLDRMRRYMQQIPGSTSPVRDAGSVAGTPMPTPAGGCWFGRLENFPAH